MPTGPMRAITAALLVFLMAGTALPEAAADDYRLAFPEDFHYGLLAQDIPRFGPAASQTRTQVDNTGGADRDGTVSAEEVEAAEKETKDFYNRGSTPSDALTVDGRKAVSGNMESVEFEGAEGPVTSEDAMIVHYVQRLDFNVASTDLHRVGIKTPAMAANMTMTTTVVAPPGFGITNITGVPGPLFVADDHTIMWFEAGAVAGDTLITMERGAQVAVTTTPPAPDGMVDGQAMWLPILALAAIVVALVVWMRIKR